MAFHSDRSLKKIKRSIHSYFMERMHRPICPFEFGLFGGSNTGFASEQSSISGGRIRTDDLWVMRALGPKSVTYWNCCNLQRRNEITSLPSPFPCCPCLPCLSIRK